MKGQPVFSDEEKSQVYKPLTSFFTDGVGRRIVILDKKKIDETSQAGKQYVRVDWTIADAETGEVKVVRYDFNFTNAMREHKDVMRFETSVFDVLPTKTGERVSNGNTYDIFSYSVQYVGEDGNAPILAENEPKRDEKIATDDLNF